MIFAEKKLLLIIPVLLLTGIVPLSAKQASHTSLLPDKSIKEPLNAALVNSVSSVSVSEPLFLPKNKNASLPEFLTQEQASAPAFLESSPFSEGLRVLSSIAVIILTAFALLWLLQKKGGIGGSVYGRVIGAIPLDGKRVLYIVEVMGRVLVLGVTESNINILCEITDKAALDTLKLRQKQTTGMKSFFEHLKPQGSPLDNENEGGEAPEPTANSFVQRTNERLQRLNELLNKNKPAAP